MISEREKMILFFVGILFFVVGVYFLRELPSDIINIKKKSEKKSINYYAISERLKIIDNTLSLKIKPSFFEYKGDFENPFRLWEERKAIKEKFPQHTEPQREKLLLKGILIKEKPLAILEDSKGNTHIIGTGEKIYEQEIISITEKSVLLRDKKGKYELKVEEP
ncbi:MAG: hypothetical protein N2053_04210 [Chitinispirillaceae bacterium]|nr:hypothetical protein [Chitinispirillaceae bacterium]